MILDHITSSLLEAYFYPKPYKRYYCSPDFSFYPNALPAEERSNLHGWWVVGTVFSVHFLGITTQSNAATQLHVARDIFIFSSKDAVCKLQLSCLTIAAHDNLQTQLLCVSVMEHFAAGLKEVPDCLVFRSHWQSVVLKISYISAQFPSISCYHQNSSMNYLTLPSFVYVTDYLFIFTVYFNSIF